MLNNIRIILVHPFHPGNIGSSLRAMKTMGLTSLTLVSPQCFPDKAVYTMAAGAADLVDNIQVVSTLAQAIANCSLVAGTSARQRSMEWPLLTAAECGQQVISAASKGEVAVVFGREKTGLTNEELQLCNYHVMIPANPGYSVLNVAQAVQIIAYEIWQAYQVVDEKACINNQPEYPDQASMVQFYQALEKTLTDINFIIPQHPGALMAKMRRMFNRTRPELAELNILRGILSRIQQNASGKND